MTVGGSRCWYVRYSERASGAIWPAPLNCHVREMRVNESEFTKNVVDWLVAQGERIQRRMPLAEYLTRLPLEFLQHTWPDNFEIDGRLRAGEPTPSSGVVALVVTHLAQWHATPDNTLEITAEALEDSVQSFVGLALLELMRRYGVARFETRDTGSLWPSPPISIEWNPLVEGHLDLLMSDKRESMRQIRDYLETVKTATLASPWARIDTPRTE